MSRICWEADSKCEVASYELVTNRFSVLGSLVDSWMSLTVMNTSRVYPRRSIAGLISAWGSAVSTVAETIAR